MIPELCEQALRKIGAVDSGDEMYPLAIETQVGKLGLYVDQESPYMVCCRFWDVNRASALMSDDLDFNKFSGKWNHLLDDDVSIAFFINRVRRLTQ